MSVLPELPKLILGNHNHYPNLGSSTLGSGNSGLGSSNSGTGNGYWVFCPDLLNSAFICGWGEGVDSAAEDSEKRVGWGQT
jgi:hypothetical protein